MPGGGRLTLFVKITLLSLAAACGGGSVSAPVLRVVGIEPGDGRLFLNQEIVVTFDRAIDPVTVTKDTVRIIDEAGDEVTLARRKVQRFTVEILPRVPKDAELDDGSFRPGRRYSLELPGFPRSNSIRGSHGELLLGTRRKTWRAVDRDALPPGHPTPLLGPGPFGRFGLVRPPSVAADGTWIELRFNRPVYPPSAVPASFVLKPSFWTGRKDDLPIESVTIDPRGEPGGLSVVRLGLARPLARRVYELYLPPASPGICDYGLSPAWIPPDESRTTHWPDLGRYFWPVHVTRGRRSAIVVERFRTARPALSGDPASSRLGLPDDVEGALAWGPDGLRLPQLGYDGFRSLGSLDPVSRTVVLQPGATRELAAGQSVELPAQAWDLDRVQIRKGHLVYVVLDPQRPLHIRVAGRFEVAGDLVFRVRGPRATAPRLAWRGPVAGDPRPSWQVVPGHVEIEVGGIARLAGRILRQDGNAEPTPAAVPGFLWGRGPFPGDWANSGLQAWQKPRPAVPAPAAAATALLPGIWGAVSPWYELSKPVAFEGLVEPIGDDPGVEVFVQGRETRGRRHAWGKPAVLGEPGLLEAVRFFVRVGGRQDTGEVLLDALRIR